MKKHPKVVYVLKGENLVNEIKIYGFLIWQYRNIFLEISFVFVTFHKHPEKTLDADQY